MQIYPQMTPKVMIRQFQLYELKRNKWIVIVLFTQGNIMINKTKQNSVSQLSSYNHENTQWSPENNNTNNQYRDMKRHIVYINSGRTKTETLN